MADSVRIADSFLRRGWGLLGHSSLVADEGLLITKTNAIHSWFMRFAFDAVYLERDGTVCRLLVEMPPFRLGPLIRRADCVLELSAGTVGRTGTKLGDVFFFEELR